MGTGGGRPCDGFRPRTSSVQGEPIERHATANPIHRQHVYAKDSGDEEHALVIRRLMPTPKHEAENKRHQLFRTRCTIGGRVFDLIIDIGSCENIIGRKTVNKLLLPIEKHPNPYSIGWIKAAEKIQVKDRCKVPFSIEKYRDEIFRDIVGMDACHLLFGRPWRYDVNAQHSGRENTYKLKKEGIKFTLLPLKMRSPTKTDSRSFRTVTQSTYEMEATMEESQTINALDVKQLLLVDDNEPRGLPEAIKPLLEKFSDIMSDELPDGLPPMRDIQPRSIDLAYPPTLELGTCIQW